MLSQSQLNIIYMYCPTCNSAKHTYRSYEAETRFVATCATCENTFSDTDAWNAFWEDVAVLDCRLAMELINAAR